MILQEADDIAEAEEIASSLSQPKKRSRDDPYDWDDNSGTEPSLSAKRAKKSSQSQSKSQQVGISQSTASDSVVMDTAEEDTDASISDDRFNVFKKSVTQLFRESRAQSVPMARFKEHLAVQHKSSPFQQSEITAAFSRMTEANQIMVADDIIFLI